MRGHEIRMPELGRRNRGLFVMLVEDDDFFSDLVIDALKKDRRVETVMRFEDGAAAEEYLRENDWPDLVITDLSMPKSDGVGFLKFAREAERNGLARSDGASARASNGGRAAAPMPVVILTNSDKAADFSEVVTNFANCFVTKPDSVGDLRTMLRFIIRSVIWSKPLPSLLRLEDAMEEASPRQDAGEGAQAAV